jgi:hypothetical protein
LADRIILEFVLRVTNFWASWHSKNLCYRWPVAGETGNVLSHPRHTQKNPPSNHLCSILSYRRMLMVHLGQLLDTVPWFDLIPSGLAGTKNIITQGGGNYGEADYITTAATGDGKVLLAYVPPTSKPSTTIAIDLAKLGGSAEARWFDPASGKYTEIAGSPLPNRGSMLFTTPGSNGGGATDWVLVLQVVPQQKGSGPLK